MTREELRKDLALLLKRTAIASWEESMREVGENPEPVREEAEAQLERWAEDYSHKLAFDVEGTDKAVIEKLVEDVSAGRKTRDEAAQVLETSFGGTRAAAIAATEVTRAISHGAIVAYGMSGISKVAWKTEGDDRVDEPCAANESAGTVHMGSPFPSGHFEPPAHVNCRCRLVGVE